MCVCSLFVRQSVRVCWSVGPKVSLLADLLCQVGVSLVTRVHGELKNQGDSAIE